MPASVLVSEVTPVPLLVICAARMLLPVFVPPSVIVCAVLVPESAIAPVLVKAIAPVPDASIVLPAVAPSVNRRFGAAAGADIAQRAAVEDEIGRASARRADRAVAAAVGQAARPASTPPLIVVEPE